MEIFVCTLNNKSFCDVRQAEGWMFGSDAKCCIECVCRDWHLLSCAKYKDASKPCDCDID